MENLKELSHKEIYDMYRKMQEYLEFLEKELSKLETTEGAGSKWV